MVPAIGAYVSCVALGVLLEWMRRERARCSCIQPPRSSHPDSAFHIRQASARDAPVILSFIRGLAEFEMQPDAVCLTEERVRCDIDEGHFECVLAVAANGQSVGMAVFFNQYSTATGRGIYLHDLYVVQSARRMGVGLALIRGVASVAHSRRCAELRWCAFDWNRKAIDFYQSPAVGAIELCTTLCKPQSAGPTDRSKDTYASGKRLINFGLYGAAIARLAGKAGK